MSLECWIYQQVHRLTCYCDCIYRSFSTGNVLEDWGFEFILLGFFIWLKIYDSSCISTTTSTEPLFYQSFLVSSTVCLRMDPVLNVKQIEATKTINTCILILWFVPDKYEVPDTLRPLPSLLTSVLTPMSCCAHICMLSLDLQCYKTL